MDGDIWKVEEALEGICMEFFGRSRSASRGGLRESGDVEGLPDFFFGARKDLW